MCQNDAKIPLTGSGLQFVIRIGLICQKSAGWRELQVAPFWHSGSARMAKFRRWVQDCNLPLHFGTPEIFELLIAEPLSDIQMS